MRWNLRATPALREIDLDLDGTAVAVTVRRHARARRTTLRIPSTGAPVVTAPVGMSDAALERFVRGHADWLADKLSSQTPARPFMDGVVIPVRGVDHRIDHRPGRRGTVWFDEDEDQRLLCVAGEEQHVARRVTDGLKRLARADLEACVVRHAATVERTVTSLKVRETRSQWGSCTNKGALSFSWRLIMAPPFVLDYVAAHEVAHLVEHNHSDRFWRLTEKLAPRTPEARVWLKQQGPLLFSIGSGS